MMKILKILLYIILAIVLAIVLIGLFRTSINYGAEITVDKSIEEAWAVHKDENKYHEWLQGYKSMELLSGEEGAIGSTYKVIVNPGEGQEDFEMIETVVDIKEFESVTLHFDSDMMLFEQTTYFEENDGKTTIKSDSEVKPKGFVYKAMFGVIDLLTGSFQKQEQKNYDALKKLIEENQTDYYPEPEPELMEIDTTITVN